MKKLLKLILSGVFVSMLFGCTLVLDVANDITVTNRTSMSFNNVYLVSNSDYTQYSSYAEYHYYYYNTTYNDILGSDILGSGGSVTINDNDYDGNDFYLISFTANGYVYVTPVSSSLDSASIYNMDYKFHD